MVSSPAEDSALLVGGVCLSNVMRALSLLVADTSNCSTDPPPARTDLNQVPTSLCASPTQSTMHIDHSILIFDQPLHRVSPPTGWIYWDNRAQTCPRSRVNISPRDCTLLVGINNNTFSDCTQRTPLLLHPFISPSPDRRSSSLKVSSSLRPSLSSRQSSLSLRSSPSLSFSSSPLSSSSRKNVSFRQLTCLPTSLG